MLKGCGEWRRAVPRLCDSLAEESFCLKPSVVTGVGIALVAPIGTTRGSFASTGEGVFAV